jgi:hypothetical protein
VKYVPDWFPGTGFKQVAKQFRKTNMEQADRPHEFVKRRMVRASLLFGVPIPTHVLKYEQAAGTNIRSFTSCMLESGITKKDEEVLKWAANSLYGGGTDTVTASLSAFYLCMTLYPEVQKKAQQEIDTVIGPHRLPTLEDHTRLPYVEGVMNEVLRWHPIGPMCTFCPCFHM